MKLLRELIALILREHEKLRRLYRAATVLACIVVFVTTYVLMLPAITLDKKAASQQTGLRLDSSSSSMVEMAEDAGQEDANYELGAAAPGDEGDPAGKAVGGEDGPSNSSEGLEADSEDGSGNNAGDPSGGDYGEVDTFSGNGSENIDAADDEGSGAGNSPEMTPVRTRKTLRRILRTHQITRIHRIPLTHRIPKADQIMLTHLISKADRIPRADQMAQIHRIPQMHRTLLTQQTQKTMKTPPQQPLLRRSCRCRKKN